MRYCVSVVIDTYNYGQYIDRAIRSAIEQDCDASRREIIVVDDGSTDDTAERVARYGALVRYIRKSNGGQASAFNAGTRAAQGDIICFLDADDYYYPSRCSAVLALFEQEPVVGAVFSRYDIVNAEGKVLAPALPTRLLDGDISGRVLLGYLSGSPTTGMSVRRDLLLKHLVPEEPFQMSADYFYLNILPLVTHVGAIPQSLHAYLSHGSNAYLTRSLETQQRIHETQRSAIWEYAEGQLGRRFVRGVHSYHSLTRQHSFGERGLIYGRDVKTIVSANVPLSLRTWTLAKITGYFLLPEFLYTRFQAAKNRARAQL